jgi:hypothetical protein
VACILQIEAENYAGIIGIVRNNVGVAEERDVPARRVLGPANRMIRIFLR